MTNLVFILDMSGSMSSLQQDTIGGYNTLLNEQKKLEDKCKVTTILFDDRYIILHNQVDIKKVEDITSKEYKPLGMTALLDAIGKTIITLDDKIENKEDKVIVNIITDGYENASKEFTWQTIKHLIKLNRERGWVFTFIGANIDVDKVSDDLGIDKRFAKKYTASAKGTNMVYDVISKVTSFARKSTVLEEEQFDMVGSIMNDIKED